MNWPGPEPSIVLVDKKTSGLAAVDHTIPLAVIAGVVPTPGTVTLELVIVSLFEKGVVDAPIVTVGMLLVVNCTGEPYDVTPEEFVA